LSKTSSTHPLDPAWETLRREFDSACGHAAQAARSELLHHLNQVFRRLHSYEGESGWAAAVLDGLSHFIAEAAVFIRKDNTLELRAARGLALPQPFSFALASAPAFAAAIETREPVVALRTPSEVTGPLSSPATGGRAHLIPVANGSRVAAVLFAAGEGYTDVNALELIAGIASLALEKHGSPAAPLQIAPAPQPVAPAPAPSASSGAVHPARRLPPWADLSASDRALHIQAQRFSRVKVAEMQLARPEACQAGRRQGNLYLFLKNEIDHARQIYSTQFMTIPSMVDYLHLELVRTAAAGDETKLGADYPGQLG
jgi:hypothetical protein